MTVMVYTLPCKKCKPHVIRSWNHFLQHTQKNKPQKKSKSGTKIIAARVYP